MSPLLDDKEMVHATLVTDRYGPARKFMRQQKNGITHPFGCHSSKTVENHLSMVYIWWYITVAILTSKTLIQVAWRKLIECVNVESLSQGKQQAQNTGRLFFNQVEKDILQRNWTSINQSHDEI